MAYEFVTASSQYLSGSAPITSRPMTASFLFRKGDNPAAAALALGNATDARWRGITPYGGLASPNTNVVETVEAGSTYSAINSDGNWSNNVWDSAMGILTSATSRSSFLGGGKKKTSTTNTGTFTTPTLMRIGGRVGFGGGLANQYFNGLLCECGIWSASLTDDEIASLGKGFKPYRIRPQSLVFYAPLIRNIQDVKAGLALTNNNTATVADHPRVY